MLRVKKSMILEYVENFECKVVADIARLNELSRKSRFWSRTNTILRAPAGHRDIISILSNLVLRLKHAFAYVKCLRQAISFMNI